MKVSVILPTHSNYDDCVEAVESILAQKYQNLELVIIVDNNPDLYYKLSQALEGKSNKIKLILKNNGNPSLSENRNLGVLLSSGDVIVFTDDDIIADENWIKNLVITYKKYHAVGVSGKIIPLWEGAKPRYLSEHLYWLIGATYPNFCEKEICKIRNGFGGNMSFIREVFKRVGYFDENLGFRDKGKKMLQGEEAEFSMRVINWYGPKILYTANAVIYHKVPKRKTRIVYLIKRSFWQGYSKGILKAIGSTCLTEENKYLKSLLSAFFKKMSLIEKIFTLTIILSVGMGYLVGYSQGAYQNDQVVQE